MGGHKLYTMRKGSVLGPCGGLWQQSHKQSFFCHKRHKIFNPLISLIARIPIAFQILFLCVSPLEAQEPQPTPLITISELAQSRDDWPAEITLKVETSFNVIIDGRTVGTVKMPAGKSVGLLEMMGDRIRVGDTTSEASIPYTDTDLLEKATLIRAQRKQKNETPPPATPPATPTTPASAIPAPESTPSSSPPPTPTITSLQLNQLFGFQLWSNKALWEETDVDVAKRLGCRTESKTDEASSYRHGAAPLLGVRAESLILNGKGELINEVIIMFTNKGDSLGTDPRQLGGRERFKNQSDYDKAVREFEHRVSEFSKRLRDDATRIKEKLTSLLGAPAYDRYGQGSDTSERVLVWNWNSHAILLSEQRDESVSIRIVPTERAQRRGKVDRIASSDLKAELHTRILKRNNGDVVLTDIPMVNQGGKGYCVPATWTRYLRYMGIPADEYVLANAANTAKGGGTNTQTMMSAVGGLVRGNGRTIDKLNGILSMDLLERYIDKGLPLMWTMNAADSFEACAQQPDRMGSGSVEDWKRGTLRKLRDAAHHVMPEPRHGHMCMLIGYNKKTGEVATSDSWGPKAAERWFVLEAAQAISEGEYYAIRW